MKASAVRWIGQLALFGIVGATNTFVDVALFWLLTATAGMPPIPANILSFSAGALNSFALNGRVTFRSAEARCGHGARALRFAITTAAALTASTGALALLMTAMPAMPAKLLSLGMSFGVGFLLQRHWVFAAAPKPLLSDAPTLPEAPR